MGRRQAAQRGGLRPGWTPRRRLMTTPPPIDRDKPTFARESIFLSPVDRHSYAVALSA